MSDLATLLVGLAIMVGIAAWVIRMYGRVGRNVAPMLESPRISWDWWHCLFLLEGIWKGLPIRVHSFYGKPPRLYVAILVVTRPPGLEAHLGRSGTIEFRAIRRDRLGVRLLARAGPSDRSAIAEYFTSERVAAIRVLFYELGWERFVRSQEGIEVSRSGGAPTRWQPHQAREQVQSTLTQLRTAHFGGTGGGEV